METQIESLVAQYARFTNAAGRVSKCFVNGYRPSVKFNDGTQGEACLVTVGECIGQRGITNCWTFKSAPILVKAERISGDWKEYDAR